MADDDRYRWLDDEVAERLLRGASVNARSAQDDGRRGEAHDNVEPSPTSTSARPGKTAPSWAADGRALSEAGVTRPAGQPERHPADRLASLLGDLAAEQTAMPHISSSARHRTGAAHGVHAGAPAELPGEAAALAAFRAAHAETVRSGAVEIGAGPAESGTVVGRLAARERRGRRPGAGRLVSLGGRPLRAGFAMAVAGCALGGVAVAATTGVLPTPFGGGGTPAASVSPLASPSGGDRDAALGGGDGSPDENNGPRRGTREGGKSGPSDSPSGEDLAGKGKGKDGKGKNGKWPEDGKGLSEAEKKAIARALCAAYEDHELSLSDRLKLEAVAGGPAGVQKFCDKHDGGGSQSGGPGNSGGIGTPGDSGGNGDVGGGGGPGGGGPGGGGPGGGDSGGDSGGDTGGSDGGDSGGVGTPSNGGADGSSGGDGDGDSGDSVPSGTDEPLGAPSQT